MAKSPNTFDDLARAFQQRDFAPLYFLYGDETLQMDELQRLLIDTALQPHEHDFNLSVFSGPEADIKNVLATCAGYPMMAERRVVVVRAFELLEGNRDFTAYAETPNPTAVVMLLCQTKPNLATHPYRALKKHAVAVEFAQPKEREMASWLVNHARREGYELEPAAAQALALDVGTELRQAVIELEKLRTFVGEGSAITEQDVLEAGGHTRDENVFELQKAIVSGNVERATRITEGILSRASNRQGEALRLVGLLSWYFQRVRQTAAHLASGLPEQGLTRRLGARPFQVKEYRNAVQRLGPGAVRAAPQALLAADFELKGGSTRDPRLILLLAIRSILSSQRRAGTAAGRSL